MEGEEGVLAAVHRIDGVARQDVLQLPQGPLGRDVALLTDLLHPRLLQAP